MQRVAITLVLLTLPSIALADSSPVPTSMTEPSRAPPRELAGATPSYRSPPPTRREWYGWMNLTSDGAAIALVVAGAGSRNGASLGYSALFVYGFGGPTIHWAHENIGAGFASLGLRAGGPVVLGLTGCLLDNGKGSFGCLGGAALGALLGTITAIVVDAAVLAYEEVEVEPRTGIHIPGSRLRRIPGIRFTPTASFDARGATLGVAGAF